MNYLVCGPPGSGKTSYALKHAKSDDLIWDMDAMYATLTGRDWYEKPASLLPLVKRIREFILAEIARGRVPSYNCWVIVGAPKRDYRNDLAYRIKAKVIVLEVPPNECLRRISLDSRRKDKVQLWEPIVKEWWRDYQSDEGDTRITEY